MQQTKIPMIQYCKGKKTNSQAELFFVNSIYSTPLSSDHHAKFPERFSSIYQRLDIWLGCFGPEIGVKWCIWPCFWHCLWYPIITVCNFKSIKSLVELNSHFLNFFWLYLLVWLDAILNPLQARPLHQILLFLRNNSLAI